MKKILIAYASFGNGHKTCALALYNYYKNKNYELEIIDINNYLSLLGRLILKLYYILIKFNRLYNYIYFKTNNKKHYHFYKLFLRLIYKSRLKKQLLDISPDIVLNTHYFPATLLTIYHIDTKIISILTDYAIHYTWHYNIDNIDALIVPTREIKNYLSSLNVNIDKVYIASIPTLTNYNNNVIKSKKKTILYIYSNHNYKYIRYLLKDNININIILVISKDSIYKKVIRIITKNNYQNIKVYGYYNKLVNIIKDVDIVITKPGGLLITESLKHLKPLLLIRGYDGQEKYNNKFVINNGFGYYNHNYQELLNNLKYLLNDSNYEKVVNTIKNYNFNTSLHDINNIVSKII